MRSSVRSLVAVAVAVAASLAVALPPARGYEPPREPEPEGGGGRYARAHDDSDSDSADFMVVVRHGDGRRCGAALVSQRAALSSAACAQPADRDLWALVPGHVRAVRVVRVAFAAARDPDEGAEGVAGDPWAGVSADLALLELATPLPAARPILMAADPSDCTAPRECNVARALPPGRDEEPGEAGLRVHEAQLDEGPACAALGPRWPLLRARTLCLVGPRLCESDRGTGVVCDGRLCGVVSRSAGAGAGAGAARCGEATAAASVPRWRRFLHCALTRGVCGRDGDCIQLCTEHLLDDAPAPPPAPAPAPAPAPEPPLHRKPPSPPPPSPRPTKPRRTDPRQTYGIMSGADGREYPARTPFRVPAPPPAFSVSAPPPAFSVPAPPPPFRVPAPPSRVRPASEFEPSRADFKMSGAGPTRVLLKAGEYGDNAAEYAAPEDVSPPSPRGSNVPSRTSLARTSRARAHPLADVEARVFPSPRPAPPPAHAHAPARARRTAAVDTPHATLMLIYLCLIINLYP